MFPIHHSPASLDEQHLPTLPKIKFSVWHTFKHHIPRFLTTILIDIILPLIIYFILQRYIKPVYALLGASSPPLFMVIFKATVSRTFDALGFLVFATFALSAIVAIISRNPIILLLEKSFITGIISLIFAITLIPCRRCHSRPLAYYLYRDLVPTNRAEVGLPENLSDEQIDQQYVQLQEDLSPRKLSEKEEVTQVYEWIYSHCPSFRYSCYAITSIWSVGFLLEFLARLSLILMHLPVNQIVLYGHMMLSSITVLCIVLTIICIAIERSYTLRYIEQWNTTHYRRRSFGIGTPSVTVKCSSNTVMNIAL